MDNQISTTGKMLYHTRKALSDNLQKKYNISDSEKIDSILKIHGFHRDQFDFIKMIEVVINERINDVSIDSNSNKGEKATEAINQEAIAPVKKAIGFDYLFRMMNGLYGRDEANRLLGEMLDLSLGLSDSTNVMKPYCWALDASDLVTIGRPFGQLHYAPAQNLSDYISQLNETVHQFSSHVAGAIAIGTFFLDIAHVLIYREKVSIEQLKSNKTIRDYIQAEMKQFIYSVNHLSRNSIESPFTNISIFDRVKLKTLVKDKSKHYYPSLDVNNIEISCFAFRLLYIAEIHS
jgi:ribonucleoside-triphosphate reductase